VRLKSQPAKSCGDVQSVSVIISVKLKITGFLNISVIKLFLIQEYIKKNLLADGNRPLFVPNKHINETSIEYQCPTGNHHE